MNGTKDVYEDKASLRDKVGKIVAEFLYSLKDGDRIFCQISGEYLKEPYIFISREYLSRKNIAFFYANYGFFRKRKVLLRTGHKR